MGVIWVDLTTFASRGESSRWVHLPENSTSSLLNSHVLKAIYIYIYIYTQDVHLDQSLPHGSRDSLWIVLKTILCLVWDSQDVWFPLYILVMYTFSKSHHLWGSQIGKPFLSFSLHKAQCQKHVTKPPPGRSFKEAIFRLGKQCPIWSSWTFSRTSGRQLLGIPAWNSIIYVELLGRWYCFQVHQNHQTMALTRSTYERNKGHCGRGTFCYLECADSRNFASHSPKAVFQRFFPTHFGPPGTWHCPSWCLSSRPRSLDITPGTWYMVPW